MATQMTVNKVRLIVGVMMVWERLFPFNGASPFDHGPLSRNQDGDVSASVPPDPTWTLTPLKAEWLRQIAGRLQVRIENDVVDDKAIALVLYDCRVAPLDHAEHVFADEVEDNATP